MLQKYKHNCLKWKQVLRINEHGTVFCTSMPNAIDASYSGTLASRILSMAKMKPISLRAAMSIVAEEQKEAFKAGNFGPEPGHFGWYADNFVEYISALGFHIELTGDEFEEQIGLEL
jgi:hypothetical protein